MLGQLVDLSAGRQVCLVDSSKVMLECKLEEDDVNETELVLHSDIHHC